MAEADTNAHANADGRCLALTDDGERCSRSAGEDGFCFQHDESDPTVSDSQAVEEDQADEETEAQEQDQENEQEQEAEGEQQDAQDQQQETEEEEVEVQEEGEARDESESSSASETGISREGTTDPSDVDTSDLDDEEIDASTDESKIGGVLAVRKTVQSTAGELIGRPFDGVSEISPTEDGWRAIVEVIERASIPDTQDVLGRYEIDLDEDGVVQGYRRLDRYRRGDTQAFE